MDTSQTEESRGGLVKLEGSEEETLSEGMSSEVSLEEGSESKKLGMSEDSREEEEEDSRDESNGNVWRHFLLHGQFEERQFHFKCLDRLKSLEDQSEQNFSDTNMIRNLTTG